MDVIIIEPNKLLANQYAEFLSQKGLSTRYCCSADDMISLMEQKKPDVIVLEILLQKHSGIELLYEIRTYNDWKNIPAVINSRLHQNDSAIDQIAMKELSIYKYLYKPEASLAVLCQAVKSLLVDVES